MKILFVATIFRHFRAFHLPYIEWFQQQGWQVDAMAGGEDELDNVHRCYSIPIQRNPYSLKNIIALRRAREIINREKYDIVYCHTAMGSVIARLASIESRKINGTKVIYMPHGFHFFKGGPKASWLLYYPVEKLLSRFTDAIITINEEDYQLVKTRGFKNGATYRIPGIGINTDRLIIPTEEKKQQLRRKFGYTPNDFILLYTAEFIQRKNHKFIIDALPALLQSIPTVKIIFAGKGHLLEKMKAYAAELGVDDRINFLGFRNDIGEIIALSDVGISSSRQEGQAINIAEEMYASLPVVATDDRGHREQIIDGFNGFRYPKEDKSTFIDRITKIYRDPQFRISVGQNASHSAEKFTLENILPSLGEIFLYSKQVD